MESSVTGCKTWILGSILPVFRGITSFSSASLFPQQNGKTQNEVGARAGVKMGVGRDVPATKTDLYVGKKVFTSVMTKIGGNSDPCSATPTRHCSENKTNNL